MGKILGFAEPGRPNFKGVESSSARGFNQIDVGIEHGLAEGSLAPFCAEPAAFGIEEFDLGGQSGLELFASIVAGALEGFGFTVGGGELGAVAREVDAGGRDFFQGIEDRFSILSSGNFAL